MKLLREIFHKAPFSQYVARRARFALACIEVRAAILDSPLVRRSKADSGRRHKEKNDGKKPKNRTNGIVGDGPISEPLLNWTGTGPRSITSLRGDVHYDEPDPLGQNRPAARQLYNHHRVDRKSYSRFYPQRQRRRGHPRCERNPHRQDKWRECAPHQRKERTTPGAFAGARRLGNGPDL